MGYCKTSWLKRKPDTCESLFKSYKFTKECDHKYTHKWTITVSKSNGDFVNMKYKEQIQTNKYELIRLNKKYGHLLNITALPLLKFVFKYVI